MHIPRVHTSGKGYKNGKPAGDKGGNDWWTLLDTKRLLAVTPSGYVRGVLYFAADLFPIAPHVEMTFLHTQAYFLQTRISDSIANCPQ